MKIKKGDYIRQKTDVKPERIYLVITKRMERIPISFQIGRKNRASYIVEDVITKEKTTVYDGGDPHIYVKATTKEVDRVLPRDSAGFRKGE